MLFNSIEFGLFLPLVFIIYWLIGYERIQLQNLFLLIASYVFYGWWDWRFLFLIIISSIADYSIGLFLEKSEKKINRKLLLTLSIVINIGLLGFFKYYNFFVDSFVDAFLLFGKKVNPTTLNIILPVGISFYTFQTLSYTLDIYKKKMEPTKNMISFFAYVSFFPQLVAGPIERASNLLPQFFKKRSFNYDQAIDGTKQILWGLFKKVVIADSCGVIVDTVFANYETMGGIGLITGTAFFAFQIYGDFSGYSDIAIGTARLFGFNLMQNFAFPYFSRDIAEFWRRWHISLSTWFRDYLYIPLGGSKVYVGKQIRNVFIIFIVSGFWHGANWTFIIWGTINALYFLPLMLLKSNRKNIEVVADKRFIRFRELISILITFALTCLAWIFFRSDSVNEAFQYIINIFRNASNLSPKQFINVGIGLSDLVIVFIFIIIMLGFEWFNRRNRYGLQTIKLPGILRYLIYYSLLILILMYFDTERSFIYFQF